MRHLDIALLLAAGTIFATIIAVGLFVALSSEPSW